MGGFGCLFLLGVLLFVTALRWHGFATQQSSFIEDKYVLAWVISVCIRWIFLT